jgi:hypothetical protein
MATISADLEERCARLEASEPLAKLSVIVTLRDGSQTSGLSVEGFEVAHAIENAPILTGAATAAGVRAIARRPDVVMVEYDDGQMHALE